MASCLPFEDFWTFATQRALQKNPLSYHKCCDAWTTRNCKFTRASHKLTITWAEFLSTLDRSGSDKKEVAKAKMVEERMQIPVLINESCRHNPSATNKSRRGRKPQKQAHPPEPLAQLLPPHLFLRAHTPLPTYAEKGIICCYK